MSTKKWCNFLCHSFIGKCSIVSETKTLKNCKNWSVLQEKSQKKCSTGLMLVIYHLPFMIASRIISDITFDENVAQMTDAPHTKPPNVASTRLFVLLVIKPAIGAEMKPENYNKKHYLPHSNGKKV